MTRRARRKPHVEISGHVSLKFKTDTIQIALERELGLPPSPVAVTQLALPIAPASPPERSAIRVRPESTPARDASRGAGATLLRKLGEAANAHCVECGRRGYHLKSCSKGRAS